MMLTTLSRFMFGTLRGRLILGVAAVHAVMMALFVGDLTARQRAMLLDYQLKEATALSQALATTAAGWIVADDVSGLQELVEIQRRYPELRFAILADEEGRVLADTDKSRKGLYLLDLPRDAHLATLFSSPALVDIAAPAMIGKRHVGWARVGISHQAADEKLAAITRNGIVYALGAILIGSVIAWFMGRRITRRLYAVQETIDAVRAGNRLARSTIAGADEAAAMAREFNSMLDAVAGRDVELRASEERYRSLIHKVQAAIVLHDSQGQILNSNPLAQELLGLSADQLLGKVLINPNWHFLRENGSVLPLAEHPVNLVLSTGQPLRDYVTGIGRPDRDDIAWVLVNAEPEYDDSGEIALVIVSFVAITERKRAEEERLAHLRFFECMDRVNRAIQGTRDLDGMMSDVLNEALSIFDCDRAWLFYPCDPDAPSFRVPMEVTKPEYPGAKVLNVEAPMPPDMAQNLREALDSVDPVTYTAGTERPINQVSAEQFGVKSQMLIALYPKSGKPWVFGLHQCSHPRVWTAEEKRFFLETGRRLGDSLSSLLAYRNLLESEKRLAEAQRMARIGNWEWDVSNDRLWWSDETYRIFETDPEEFEPTFEAFVDAVHPDDRERVQTSIAHALRDNSGNWQIEYRTACADGTIRFVHEVAETVFDRDGRPLKRLGTVQDITERKRAEEDIRRLNQELEERVEERTAQLEAANKELESFAYSVSHDLRAPLRSIDGFSQVLLEDYSAILDEEGKRYLHRVRASTQRMAQLIDDLLSLSRVTRGEVRLEKVNLSRLAHEIARELARREPDRKVLLTVAPEVVVTGDARFLRVALENLLDNAWKFTGKRGEPTIEFGVTELEGRRVYFVRDNGAGFDMKYAGRLFGAFQRLHTTEEFPGTGIGLATVQRIIHRHGGRVWAEGRMNEGATFYFTLQ